MLTFAAEILSVDQVTIQSVSRFTVTCRRVGKSPILIRRCITEKKGLEQATPVGSLDPPLVPLPPATSEEPRRCRRAPSGAYSVNYHLLAPRHCSDLSSKGLTLTEFSQTVSDCSPLLLSIVHLPLENLPLETLCCQQETCFLGRTIVVFINPIL
jgi:hypothetical protein